MVRQSSRTKRTRSKKGGYGQQMPYGQQAPGAYGQQAAYPSQAPYGRQQQQSPYGQQQQSPYGQQQQPPYGQQQQPYGQQQQSPYGQQQQDSSSGFFGNLFGQSKKPMGGPGGPGVPGAPGAPQAKPWYQVWGGKRRTKSRKNRKTCKKRSYKK